jgi:ABC-type glutathione transport system ATPase component
VGLWIAYWRQGTTSKREGDLIMADGCIETVNGRSVLLTGCEKIARLLGTASRRLGRVSSGSSADGADNGAQPLKVDKNETLLDVATSAGPMHKLVDVRNLKKTFNKYTAVEDVSFYIDEGEFVGLVGPNGAGKTTTIHMTLGLIKPDAGEVRIFGKPFEKNRNTSCRTLISLPLTSLIHRG